MPALRPARNSHRVRFFKRWNLRFVAKRRLREVHLKVVDQVVSVTLEVLVGLHVHLEVEVAAWPAAFADFAFSGESHLRPIVDATGYLHLEFASLGLVAATTASLARFGDDSAFSLTSITHRDVDELAEHTLLDAAQFAGTLAVGASLRFAAGLGAPSLTVRAQLEPINVDRFVGTERRLFK